MSIRDELIEVLDSTLQLEIKIIGDGEFTFYGTPQQMITALADAILESFCLVDQHFYEPEVFKTVKNQAEGGEFIILPARAKCNIVKIPFANAKKVTDK